jgi:hypothetical protein
MLGVEPLGHVRLFHTPVTKRGFMTFLALFVLWRAERG